MNIDNLEYMYESRRRRDLLTNLACGRRRRRDLVVRLLDARRLVVFDRLVADVGLLLGVVAAGARLDTQCTHCVAHIYKHNAITVNFWYKGKARDRRLITGSSLANLLSMSSRYCAVLMLLFCDVFDDSAKK